MNAEQAIILARKHVGNGAAMESTPWSYPFTYSPIHLFTHSPVFVHRFFFLF